MACPLQLSKIFIAKSYQQKSFMPLAHGRVSPLRLTSEDLTHFYSEGGAVVSVQLMSKTLKRSVKLPMKNY
jgi:hypothetical protein